MKKSILFLLLLITVLSCSKETDKIDILTPKDRTLLIYVALDNDLSGEMSELRASILKGWTNAEINNGSLLVLADTWGGEPILMEVVERNGKAMYDTLRTYTNDNSASPELLREVIGDTKMFAPADSYGLILFSHASGWLPAKAFGNPAGWGASMKNEEKLINRSLFVDRGREMELADFAASIPDGMFDFIGSEMCFMSSVETAYALRYKTDYLLASAPEVLKPGFRPVYESSLDLLYKPKADLIGFAQAFYDYFDGLKGDYRSAAMSVVRTSEMEALAAYTREIAPSLTQEQINEVQVYDRNGRPNVFFDFRDYIAQIATEKEMEQLDGLLDKAVIFKINTPKLIKLDIEKHSGLSVYIPQDGLPKLNDAYLETEWAKAVMN